MKPKINLKKIFAVTLVASMCACILSISVLADFSFEQDGDVLVKDVINIKECAEAYLAGEMTAEELGTNTLSSCARLGVSVSDIITLDGTRALIQALDNKGIDIPYAWGNYFTHHGGGSSGGNRGDPSFDLKGEGFCIIASPIPGTGNDMSLIYYYYGDYAVINNPELFSGNHFTYNSSSNVTMYNCICEAYKNGSYNSSYSFSNRKSSYSQSFYGYTLQLYGDIRYRDNSPADDVITPIEYTIPDWTAQDEPTLKDFLDDLINQLSLQYPDLSTVEGLLAAILAECQSINGKICTAPEIQTMLDNAISQLQNNGGGDGDISVENTQLIIAALENLKYENNNELFISDLEELLGLNGDYDEISRMELVEYSFREKTGFITDLREICDSVISAYSNGSESVSITVTNPDVIFGFIDLHYDLNFDYLNKFMPTVRLIIAVYIYISFAWNTYRKIPEYISGG